MTEDVEFDWVRWRDTPPHASCIPIEVVCDGWAHVRLWRPCSNDMLRLAQEGGIYGAEGEALYGSPPLVVNTADPNGPWPCMFVLRPPRWPHCGPPGRLWLVPPCGELTEVPATIFGGLVAVADGGEPVVMRGPTVDQLRALAEQIVGLTGGFRA